VASCNVQETLSRSDAMRTLALVLGQSPNVVGLQEWSPRRWRLLCPSGSVRAAPGGLRVPGASPDGGEYAWCAGLVGGCVVGVRRDKFALQGCSVAVLSWPGPADRDEGRFGLEAPRVAVVIRCRDRADGRLLALVGYHLVHGVQRGAGYRDDRPRLVARHRHEVSRLTSLVADLQAEGRDVLALGDSNFHGFRLPQLTSAWSADRGDVGTLGRRRVDDVHAPKAPVSVTSIGTPSDHRAVIAHYDGLG
jgi:hypothetical protein